MKNLDGLLKEPRMLNNAGRRNSLMGLYDLVRDQVTEETTIVEIGCHRGVSTELFAMFCKKIYTIDPWDQQWDGGPSHPNTNFSALPDEAEKEARKRLSKYSNVEIIKDYSKNVYNKFGDESLDMIYIDGEHTEVAVREDVTNWVPKIKKGGVISGHDGRVGGVNRACFALLGESGIKRYKDHSWRYIKQ